jgi:hypothetical protein
LTKAILDFWHRPLVFGRDKEYITEEKRQQIIFSFGPKNLELIDYSVNRLEDHILDTSDYLDRLKRKT